MGAEKIISFLVVEGLRLLIQIAIVVVAIIAARRHKLPGLWILAGAALATAIHVIANIAISSPFGFVEHDEMMKYFQMLGYLYYSIMFIALCGWCALAFSRRKGTDA